MGFRDSYIYILWLRCDRMNDNRHVDTETQYIYTGVVVVADGVGITIKFLVRICTVVG